MPTFPCDTLPNDCPAQGQLPKLQRADMNIARTSLPSTGIGLKALMLLLAWVIVAGLSCADLFDLHHVAGGPSTDLQQATEPDLDEIRDDATTIRVVGAHSSESLAIHPALVLHFPSSQAVDWSTEGLLSKLSVYRL